MRFTYDAQAAERRKSKAVIRYGDRQWVAGKEYGLVGVVIHLGNSVSDFSSFWLGWVGLGWVDGDGAGKV